MTKVTPFLMFNDQLEAAITFYAETFPDSQVKSMARTGNDGPVTSAEARALGLRVVAEADSHDRDGLVSAVKLAASNAGSSPS